jgi:hypothetical protein
MNDSPSRDFGDPVTGAKIPFFHRPTSRRIEKHDPDNILLSAGLRHRQRLERLIHEQQSKMK